MSGKRDESPTATAGEEEESCPKRLRSMSPDVKVVVGSGDNKKIFHHYAAILCNSSEYFDVALSSSFKEGTTRVLEFPDKDPHEWEQVVDFFHLPAESTEKITIESIGMLVPWFSELRMTGWLAVCDKVLVNDVLHERDSFKALGDGMTCKKRAAATAIIHNVLDKLSVAVAYQHALVSSLEEGLSFLDNVFEKYIYYFDPEAIGNVIDMLKYQDVWNRLWPRVRLHLPSIVRDAKREELVDNPLLEQVLHQKAEISFLEKHCEEKGAKPANPRYY